MKLTQQLLSISEESAVAKSAQTQAELLKAHQKAKKVSADKGVVQHVNKDKTTGRIYTSDWYDDDETIASYNNGKLKQGPVKEASELNDVTIDDMKDKKEPGANKNAEEMEVGDAVKIVGGVEHDGEQGQIERFGHEKKFVVVKFKDGSMASFHSSDVEELLGGEEEDDDNEDYDEDKDTFYVAFYDEDEHASWIGRVTKADGGKWHEEKYQGKPDYRWGTSYMSYLTPAQVMQWIHKDYRRGMEIEGPFFTPAEAIEYAEHNWGAIKEGVEMNEGKSFTDFDAWKQAVLTSYPAQAKKIKFKGRMEGNKDTISAEIPGEDRSYGVWDQDTEKGVVLSEAVKQSELKKAQAIFKRDADADMDYEDVINLLTDEGFSEEVAHEVAIDNGRVAPKGWGKKITEAVKDMIEAHGIKGMSRTPWRRTFKDEDAMVAWAEKFDAEIYGQRETDYAAQMKKDKPVKEDVHKAAVEWFKAEKPEECPKCKSSDFYRTSFGHTQKIVCSKCGQVAAKKDIKEGVVDAIKKSVKSVKRGMQGWGGVQGKPAEIAKRARGYSDDQLKKLDLRNGIYNDVDGKPAPHSPQALQQKVVKRELEKRGTVQRTLYKANNKDHDTTWSQTGKSGKHMQNGEHTQEWQELDKNGKPTGQREWRNMAGEYVGEGVGNKLITPKAAVKSLTKSKKSVVDQCAELAAKYFNSAGLQHDFEIDEYIKGEMKKRGITEGVNIAIAEMWGDSDHAPDKMSKKGEASYVAKLKARNMPNLRKGSEAEKISSKRNAQTDMTNQKCSDSKCKGHFKETSMNDDMDGKLHCDKCGKETKRYAAIKEGISPFKPNARVKIISGPKDVVGKEGTIGEVVTTNGQKSYTVDYDHDFKSDKPNFGAKSIRLQPKDIKLIRDAKVKESKGDGEQLEVINKAHADNGTAKKVFFTGTYEECKEFMRTHKSLKMDLMYKESGRLASYKL